MHEKTLFSIGKCIWKYGYHLEFYCLDEQVGTFMSMLRNYIVHKNSKYARIKKKVITNTVQKPFLSTFNRTMISVATVKHILLYTYIICNEVAVLVFNNLEKQNPLLKSF